MTVVDEREGADEGGGEEEEDRCSAHTGQFIKIIKPGLVLKVEPTINLTGTQADAVRHRHRQANKQNGRSVVSPSTLLSALNSWKRS